MGPSIRLPAPLSLGNLVLVPMKHLALILVMASPILLGGCATPLTVERDSGRFVTALGISTNEVLFLSYGRFGQSPKGPKPSFRENQVVVVATASQLQILYEPAPKNSEPKHISLKYSAMQSVARKTQGFNSELQIEGEDCLILLQIIPNKVTGNLAGSKTLLNLITAAGVRVVEAKQYYDFEASGSMSPIYFGPLF